MNFIGTITIDADPNPQIGWIATHNGIASVIGTMVIDDDASDVGS